MSASDKNTVIKLKQVDFAYPDAKDKLVIDIENWTVHSGEQVFMYGPSGCGKSTLLKLLGGMLVPSSGELSVLNTRLDTISQSQRDIFRADNIGYVFQDFNLIPYLSALENIQLATCFTRHRESGKEAIETLLSQLSLELQDYNKPVSRLSSGQQQRVAIARALINQPALLIADEPTSSLDQYNRDQFMSLLMSMAEAHAITVVFVSHDLSLSDYFKRVDALTDINKGGA